MLSLKATDSVTAEEAQRWRAVAFPDDPGFSNQMTRDPVGGSQSYLTLVPGDPVTSSNLY